MRVIRDREVRVAAALRLGRHLVDRVLPVARPGRMSVQVAAEVTQLHELWQLPVPGGFELAKVLAQLRRDVLVAEELVERLLAAGLEDLSGLDLLDAVLGD